MVPRHTGLLGLTDPDSALLSKRNFFNVNLLKLKMFFLIFFFQSLNSTFKKAGQKNEPNNFFFN